MSRKEIVGEKFTIAFGVDTFTGAFAQLWVNPAIEQDGAFVRIDSNGVSVDSEVEVENASALNHYLNKLVERFAKFKKDHPKERPNLGEQDVKELAIAAGGFPDIAMDVYRVFGDDV